MKKIFKLLPIFTFLLAGCNFFANKNIKTPNTDNFTYNEAIEEAIVVTKEGVEVSNVEVTNIPTSGIKIALFDDANVKLHVTYSDGSTNDFDFKEKNIPLSFRHYLGEIGHHTFVINISGIETRFAFDIIRNPDFSGYKCQFIHTKTAEVLEIKTVGYYQTVEYTGRPVLGHDVDDQWYCQFMGWDHPLEYVHQNMNYATVFKNIEKRYYGRSTMNTDGELMLSKDNTDSKSALIYVGRVYNVPINYGDTTYHAPTEAEKEIKFNPINPFNEKWNMMNDNILKYGINYVHNPKYSSYLYGNVGGFVNAPIYLSDFEAGLTPTSKSVSLDNKSLVDTSIESNYQTVYNEASNHINETLTLTSEDEAGYYRLALTSHFDIYISITLSNLGNNKYALSSGSKLMFSPVKTSIKLLKQFSFDEEFVAPFDSKTLISNEQIYNVANSLDWGNL